MKNWCEIEKIPRMTDTYKIGRGKNSFNASTVCIGFDIETTNNDIDKNAFMYIWQCAVNGIAYYGRTWDEFFEFLDILRQKIDGRIFIFIHNMGFEMSFLLPRLHKMDKIERLFARAKYEPLSVLTTDNIEFRDTMALTNMTLATLAKNFTKTQKLRGDLDYKIMRNNKTRLTIQELKYCENDVLILSEYAEKIHAEYTENGEKIPYTSTGIVRKMVKKSIGKQYGYVKKLIPELFPETVDKYNFIMKYLFRGGYCHAQTAKCDMDLTNVISHDLKSAYPAEMCHNLYPMSKFKPYPPEKALEACKSGHAVIMICEFMEICATTAHVVESKHKIINSINAEFENGRLYCAEKITVFLTDVDFDIYQKFYKWDKMQVLQCKVAVKKPLPDYLLKPLFTVFSEKERIGALPERKTNSELSALYMLVKSRLNSFYGMCVSRLNLTEFDFNGEWFEIQKTTYADEIKKQFLSPYWGIYITAYTRQTVLNAIYACGVDAYYSDTDSVKHVGHENYFKEYNSKIEKINADMCKKYNLDFLKFQKLGMFEYECTYDHFKTLGAKRYITIISDKIECTVAGLPKQTFTEYAKNVGIENAYHAFKNDMTFEISGKNAHQYGGECTAYIRGVKMHELGYCYIFSVPFTMSIEKLFLSQMYQRKEI